MVTLSIIKPGRVGSLPLIRTECLTGSPLTNNKGQAFGLTFVQLLLKWFAEVFAYMIPAIDARAKFRRSVG
jgi:hypothetical protein